MSGDRKMKTEGEIKQAQAAALNTAADVKDKAQNFLDDTKSGLNTPYIIWRLKSPLHKQSPPTRTKE